jgi:murein L,D-transpeptidase YcbB/YkuD
MKAVGCLKGGNKNMLRKSYFYLLIILFMLGGCVTAEKDYETQSLKERVLLLEAQIQEKESQIAQITNASNVINQEKNELQNIIDRQEEKIESLTKSLQKIEREKEVFPKSKSKTYYSFVIKIQTALKNAGFDPGLIDGKLGSRTRRALKEFQSSNGLPSDGRVDKQTWDLLRNHL